MFLLDKIKSELSYDISFRRKYASSIINGNKHEDISVLINALIEEDENFALICSDILVEISEIKPSMLESEVDLFIKIFETGKNKLYYNCLRILIALVPIKHGEIYKGLNNVMEAFFSDDVRNFEVKNEFVRLIVALTMISSNYYEELCSALKITLEHWPSDYIVSFAETVLPIVDKTNCEDFKKILNFRKVELNVSGQKAIEKILSSPVFT